MSRPIPRKLARKLLLSFLRDDLVEEVLGDLDEKFYMLVQKRSLFMAKLNYWYQVLNYLRPFALKKSKTAYSNHYTVMPLMIRLDPDRGRFISVKVKPDDSQETFAAQTCAESPARLFEG